MVITGFYQDNVHGTGEFTDVVEGTEEDDGVVMPKVVMMLVKTKIKKRQHYML